MGKWCNLPLDLLYIIEDYVALYIDKVRFRVISLEWNSYLPKLPDHRDKKIQLLLHPVEHEEEATHRLFNPLDKNIYKLYVPELNGKLLRGSSYGWIVAIEEIDTDRSGIDEIYLINPITRAQIKLPPRKGFSDGGFVRFNKKGKPRLLKKITSDFEFSGFSMEFTLNGYHMKIVLSSDPYNGECVVVATFCRGEIAWCKPYSKKWRRVDTLGFTEFVDILYSKSCLYALTIEGRVIMIENIGTDLEIMYKEITTDGLPIPIKRSAYLAECSDGSLIVAAQYFVYHGIQDHWICTNTKEFKVYKLFSNPESSWVEVKSIDNDVLFFGFGSVRSIPSRNLAEFKRNHIYFCDFAKLDTDDEENKNVKSCIGVFSLEDGTVQQLQGRSDIIWRRHIWTNFGFSMLPTCLVEKVWSALLVKVDR